MAWQTECPASEGWERRIAVKTTAAGVTGGAAGSVLAMLRHARMLQYTLGMGASCAFAFGTYSALQEAARRVRCVDDAINSAAAGAATAYMLVGIQQGDRRKAGAAAAVCAAAAATAHVASGVLIASPWVRRRLQDLDLLDAGEAELQQRAAEEQLRKSTGYPHGKPPWWESWLPIKRMTDAEWETHQARKASSFQKRVEATVEGGLPAMLEKERARLEQRRLQRDDSKQSGNDGT